MLQIRLSNKGSASQGAGGGKSLAVETVTVACPDHLVLADLPVAKSIGTATTPSTLKIVGRKSRRHLGERVHICVCCDFPIAIYGRLSPCEHAFCLDCARSDSSCYLCEERIQKIQTIKMMEGIFICAAPHCLKSFLKNSEFEAHIYDNHADLLESNVVKEGVNESDAFNGTRASSTDAHAKQSVGADASTARTLPRTGFSSNSLSQSHDPDEKAHHTQTRDQPPLTTSTIQPTPPPYYGRNPNYPPEGQSENNTAPVFDRRGPYNRFHNQHKFDMQGSPLHRSDSDQLMNKQRGISSEFPFANYSPQSQQLPNYVVPVNTNQGRPAAYNTTPVPLEGAQQFYNAHYETTRLDMPSESGPGPGPGHGSLLGFPPAPAGGNSFPGNYPPQWNMGPGIPFDQIPASRGMSESYANQSDSQGGTAYFQGDYGRMPGGISLNPLMPPMGSASDNNDQKGSMPPQPRPPPPPPLPRHPSIFQQGNFPRPGDQGQEGQNYSWPHEKHGGYGGGQE